MSTCHISRMLLHAKILHYSMLTRHTWPMPSTAPDVAPPWIPETHTYTPRDGGWEGEHETGSAGRRERGTGSWDEWKAEPTRDRSLREWVEMLQGTTATQWGVNGWRVHVRVLSHTWIHIQSPSVASLCFRCISLDVYLIMQSNTAVTRSKFLTACGPWKNSICVGTRC